MFHPLTSEASQCLGSAFLPVLIWCLPRGTDTLEAAGRSAAEPLSYKNTKSQLCLLFTARCPDKQFPP